MGRVKQNQPITARCSLFAPPENIDCFHVFRGCKFRRCKKGTRDSYELNESTEFQISFVDVFCYVYNTFLFIGTILVMERGFDFKPYLKNLYDAILYRLRAADIDQEVKEKSITCMYVLGFVFVILVFVFLTPTPPSIYFDFV